MKKNVLSFALAAAMTATLLAGCGSSGASSSAPAASGSAAGSASGAAIKIGGIGPLTGSAAAYGVATRNGAQIAVDEINAKGGLQLEMNFQDDEADPEKGVNAYHNLQDWGMQLLYGCTTTGSCINVASETYSDRYFQITPSASSADVTSGKDNVFQVCFTDPGQGATAANYLSEQGLAKKVAVLYNNGDAYSTGIATAFAAQAAANGLEVVSNTTFPDDSNTDFSVQLADAKKNGAELVFMPIYYTPASLVLNQAKSMGYAPIFFGGDGMDGILTMEGFDTAIAEDLMLMTPFNASDASAADFVEKYKAAYNEVPNQFAADGYDAIYAIYAACQKANITSDMSHEDVCEAMIAALTAADFSIDGLTGAGMTWGTNGEVDKAPMVVKVENGAYVTM